MTSDVRGWSVGQERDRLPVGSLVRVATRAGLFDSACFYDFVWIKGSEVFLDSPVIMVADVIDVPLVVVEHDLRTIRHRGIDVRLLIPMPNGDTQLQYLTSNYLEVYKQ